MHSGILLAQIGLQISEISRSAVVISNHRSTRLHGYSLLFILLFILISDIVQFMIQLRDLSIMLRNLLVLRVLKVSLGVLQVPVLVFQIRVLVPQLIDVFRSLSQFIDFGFKLRNEEIQLILRGRLLLLHLACLSHLS